ncbi:uncharacterized protein [Epargyreus clarus]|uniref:uncharacterized protein n=1 Tax=Epargyreus clarus TaxID=520877 RepID=UPI003C2E62AF
MTLFADDSTVLFTNEDENELEENINSAIFKIIQWLRNLVDLKAVLTAYHGFVATTLRYGVMFWGNSTNRELAFKAQRRCIRAMCNLKQRDSCKPHFKKLHILTLPSLYIFECAVFVKSNPKEFQFRSGPRHKDKLTLLPAP